MKLTPERVLQNFATRFVSARRLDQADEPAIAPAASTLSCFLSSNVDGSRLATVSLPSLELRPAANRANSSSLCLLETALRSTEGSGRKRSLRSVAGGDMEGEPPAANLARPRRFVKADIPQAPSVLLENLAASFQACVDDALRSMALLIMRRSLVKARAGKIDASTARAHAQILGLLYPPLASSSSSLSSAIGEQAGGSGAKRKSSPVRVVAAATNWATLPSSSSSTSPPSCGPACLVLPLIFEAVIDVDVLGMGGPSVALRAPGTISAKFNRLTSRIETAAVVLDTAALHGEMVAKAANLSERAAEVAFAAVSSMLQSRKQGGEGSVLGGTAQVEATALVDGFGDGDDTCVGSPACHETTLSPPVAAEVANEEAAEDVRRMMPPPPPRPPHLSTPSLKRRRFSPEVGGALPTNAAAASGLNSLMTRHAGLANVAAFT